MPTAVQQTLKQTHRELCREPVSARNCVLLAALRCIIDSDLATAGEVEKAFADFSQELLEFHGRIRSRLLVAEKGAR